MKNFIKKHTAKLHMVAAMIVIALTPIPAAAAGVAPSTYVNKISDGLFGEILKVAPKIAGVVIAWSLIMYLTTGDDHKKSKHKSTGWIAVIITLVLLVIKPLMDWFSGLI